MESFVECESIEQANKVDQTIYKFVTFSESRGYVFAKRMRPVR